MWEISMHVACPFLRVNLDNATVFRTAGAPRNAKIETNDACSPNTVHIVFDLLWHVKVDHLKKGSDWSGLPVKDA